MSSFGDPAGLISSSLGTTGASRAIQRRLSKSEHPTVITLNGSARAPEPQANGDANQPVSEGLRRPLLARISVQQRSQRQGGEQDVQIDIEAGSQEEEGADDNDEQDHKVQIAMWLSFVANVGLLVAKLYGFWLSHSYSVLASAADSLVDILSQAVLAFVEWQMNLVDPLFPVGKTRLETVGVVGCAVIMSVATLEVIQQSAETLYAGLAKRDLPELDMGILMYSILGATVGIKFLLWMYCSVLRKSSETMVALAEDHMNDVMSSAMAIGTAALASISKKVWWIDPAGAILISCYIIYSWGMISKSQIDKIVGRSAPTEFVAAVEQIAEAHHATLAVDVIRAYYFGSRFIVEVEVVLPAEMTVRESHDIGIQLQHKLEALEEVERAFVHIDYSKRAEPEHKVERNLLGHRNPQQPHDSVAHSSGSAHDLAAAISGGLEGRTSGLSSVGEGSRHGKSGSQHGNQAAAALLGGRESCRSGLSDRNSSKSGAFDPTASINVPGKK